MSGGGRCNFTNLHIDPENHISSNMHFVKSALSSYTHWDLVTSVEKHGIAYHEKTLYEEAGVKIQTHCQMKSVEQLSDACSLQTSLGEFGCHGLVVATVGLSVSITGASGFGDELAEQFGLDVLDRSAALVPLTFSDQWQSLYERPAGLSTDVVMASSRQSFREGSLFTHWGLSGPVSLQVSSYWSPGQPITINLMPDCDASGYLLDAKGRHGNLLVRTVLTQLLPKTLVNELEALLWSSYQITPLAEIPDAVLQKIGLNLFPRRSSVLAPTSGGHSARGGYASIFFEDTGVRRPSRAVFHRRGGRCDWSPCGI